MVVICYVGSSWFCEVGVGEGVREEDVLAGSVGDRGLFDTISPTAFEKGLAFVMLQII